MRLVSVASQTDAALHYLPTLSLALRQPSRWIAIGDRLVQCILLGFPCVLPCDCPEAICHAGQVPLQQVSNGQPAYASAGQIEDVCF